MLDAMQHDGQPRHPSLSQAAVEPLARCVHDLVRNECIDCRPVRPGLPARVAITSGGAVFHIAKQCEGLHDGWRRLSRSGGTPSDLVWVPIADALAAGRGSCEKCCAHLDLT
jgi:hypothetical protein